MSGLTPQQSAAIQQALQAGDSLGPNASGQQISQDWTTSLGGSGLFDPSVLQNAASMWTTPNESSAAWQSGPVTAAGEAADQGNWLQQMTGDLTNALGQQQQQQQTMQSLAPDPTTPAAQATAAGFNPLQPAYVSPTTLNQGQINSLSPQQTISALTGANQPQVQQQDQQMMQMLATAGLAPSSTAGQTAFNNLAQQQLAGMDPSIASAIQNSQGNLLNAGQFNATTANTANQNNANAFNTAGQNYFNAETGAYNNNANAFNALNTAGLSGAQGLAAGQQSGGNSLASGQQNNFPVYSNPFSGVSASALGSAGSYPQPTATQSQPTQNGNLNSYYGNLDSSGGF